MRKVYVIWEYEQRRGYDREEPIEPFYASRAAADAALEEIGTKIYEGYREVREHQLQGETGE